MMSLKNVKRYGNLASLSLASLSLASLSVVCLAAVFALPMSAHAGEITRAATQSSFQWKSTECPRPIVPLSSPNMTEQDRLLRYARDIEVYIDCIQREAQRDFEKAQQELQIAIERDLEKQTKTMNDMMLQAAKTMR